jgi:hypothetical protein
MDVLFGEMSAVTYQRLGFGRYSLCGKNDGKTAPDTQEQRAGSRIRSEFVRNRLTCLSELKHIAFAGCPRCNCALLYILWHMGKGQVLDLPRTSLPTISGFRCLRALKVKIPRLWSTVATLRRPRSPHDSPRQSYSSSVLRNLTTIRPLIIQIEQDDPF